MSEIDTQIMLDYVFGIFDTNTVEVYEQDIPRISAKYNLSNEYLQHFVEVYNLDALHKVYKDKIKQVREKLAI